MLSQIPQDQAGPSELPPAAIERLEMAMKQWRQRNWNDPDSADAFRYEMVSRRLQSATEGVASAVKWAWIWYQELVAEDAQKLAAEQAIADQKAAISARVRAEIRAGHSDNPHFQAFLDTLEDPARELYRDDGTFEGWKYLVWIGPLIGQAESSPKCPLNLNERQEFASRFIQQASARQRAARLGGPIPESKETA